MSGIGDFRNNPQSLDKAIRVRATRARQHRLKIINWVEYFHKKANSYGQVATYRQMAIALNHKGLRTIRGKEFTMHNLSNLCASARERGDYDTV